MDRMRMELEVANNALQSLDGQEIRTFAFPCSFPLIGKAGLLQRSLKTLRLDKTRVMGWFDRLKFDIGSTQVDYTPVVKETCFAARRGGIVEDWPTLYNRYCVPAFPGDEMTSIELQQAVDRTIEHGKWSVFVFHGIGAGHSLAVNADAFDELIKRVATDTRVEVLTFRQAAQRLWPNFGEGNEASSTIRNEGKG